MMCSCRPPFALVVRSVALVVRSVAWVVRSVAWVVRSVAWVVCSVALVVCCSGWLYSVDILIHILYPSSVAIMRVFLCFIESGIKHTIHSPKIVVYGCLTC
jgi:hypothetical protein